MSLDRIREYLKQVDECTVVDLLGLTTEDILSRFEDVILERRTYIERELEVQSDTEDNQEETID